MVYPGFDSRGWYWVVPINNRTFGWTRCGG
jgi:hypothetical protein